MLGVKHGEKRDESMDRNDLLRLRKKGGLRERDWRVTAIRLALVDNALGRGRECSALRVTPPDLRNTMSREYPSACFGCVSDASTAKRVQLSFFAETSAEIPVSGDRGVEPPPSIYS